MRTFIAIDMNKKLKESICDYINEFKKINKSNIKWIKENGLHVTLKFLGEIPEEKISDIDDILENIAKNHKPVSMTLKGTGFFPPNKTPRVLWIGIETNNTLSDIQSQLEEELQKLGFPKEKRRFSPHLTMGRIKKPFNLQPVLLKIEADKEKFFGEMMAEKITFFRSVLKPSGAEYSVISERFFK
jgi:2'-5' RNA ligase